MRVIRYAVVFTILFLSLKTANAQTAVNYRFVEVLDANGKPVADAQVSTLGPPGPQQRQTDKNGTVEKLPIYYGDYNTTGIKVSKPGYITYEDVGLFDRLRYPKLLYGEIHGYAIDSKIKVVLLKAPVTEAERKALESRQRGRDLILAVKKGDVAAVEKLLQDAVSADTQDDNGIPAILWAAAGGNSKMIKALLAARADVRAKGKPGRRALLYYLACNAFDLFGPGRDNADYELVQLLINAGADVNAVDLMGNSVMGEARTSGKDRLIKLLESAGGH
jgi:hypothetical protein